MNKIEEYSYYFSDSEEFVKEYLGNYKEMEKILKRVFKNIKEMKVDYNISLGVASISFENKKTKESYFMRIGF